MSLIFSSRKAPHKKSGSEIAKRDMTQKRKVIRKVQELPEHGRAQVTTTWMVDFRNTMYKISFSRDNLHVWINGRAVETTSYITDKGYDVDLFFALDSGKGHIYSDVEGAEMMNYLLINDEIKGQEYQSADDVK